MTIKSRSYFSVPYFCGAARFSRDALAIETKTQPADFDLVTHRALVIAAVTSSAAALQSMINEVFADASEIDGGCVGSISDASRAKLSAIWSIPKTSGYPILDKFDVAHLLVTGRKLDRSVDFWHNATWVVRLRNEFVHFEPTWAVHPPDSKTMSQDSDNKFEKALRNKFACNKLAGSGNAFFPDRLLGHGCAAWAMASALAFADVFWKSINATPHYDAYRHMFDVK